MRKLVSAGLACIALSVAAKQSFGVLYNGPTVWSGNTASSYTAPDNYAPTSFSNGTDPAGNGAIVITTDPSTGAANRPAGKQTTTYNTQGYSQAVSTGLTSSQGYTLYATMSSPATLGTAPSSGSPILNEQLELDVGNGSGTLENIFYMRLTDNSPSDNFNASAGDRMTRVEYYDAGTANGNPSAWNGGTASEATAANGEITLAMTYTPSDNDFNFFVNGTDIGTASANYTQGATTYGGSVPMNVGLRLYNYDDTVNDSHGNAFTVTGYASDVHIASSVPEPTLLGLAAAFIPAFMRHRKRMA